MYRDSNLPNVVVICCSSLFCSAAGFRDFAAVIRRTTISSMTVALRLRTFSGILVIAVIRSVVLQVL